MNIVMMGAPGAGKGTQADLMERRLRLPHVASGDLFRENIKNNTDLGKQVRAILDRGDLVPDSVTIGMIRQRMSQPDCAQGIILDGFPRTIQQAEALDTLFAERADRLNRVLYIKIDNDVLVGRLAGRWFCKICQTPYNVVSSPPKVAGVCDRDGGELIQRPDDRPETVAHRLRVYFDQTSPLIEHYRAKGLLSEINGEQGIEQVYGDIVQQIEGATQP
ncbi:MAG: adenylate kinase [Chloroflexi bacterium]|nr:adenylate kinase [Chloroflexota bacterium]